MRKIPPIPLLLFPFILAFITGCSSSTEIQSTYSGSISVDGTQLDWEGKLLYFKDENISIGFTNNDKNLYICLVAADQANIRSLMMTPLTIWLTPPSGMNKIGLKYPVREFDEQIEPGYGKMPDQQSRENPQDMFDSFIKRHDKISVVNKDNFSLYLLYSDSSNIEFKANIYKGNFVYELKIPLITNKDAKYFVEAAPGDILDIAFETEDMEKPNMSGMGGGPGGGGPPMGGGNRRGAPPSGGPGMGTPRQSFDLDIKCSVTLAK